MPRFNRTYRLLVGPGGGKGVEIKPPLRVTFDVEKDTKEEPNYQKVRIWNLSPATRAAVVEPDSVVALYAGYVEEDGALLLASGTVVTGYTYFDGPDVVTEIEFLDGYLAIRDTVVSLGYGAGVKASAICKDIAAQMGLSLMMDAAAPDRVWNNGFSFYGAAATGLHKVVQGTGLEWSIQNGTLQIIPRLGTTKRQAFVLNSGSGLIGHPVRTREGAREKAKVKDKKTGDSKTLVSAKQQTDGWKVDSLLLPALNPGDMVKLESRSVTGWFRCESLKHSGDIGGPGDMQSELQLIEVK